MSDFFDNVREFHVATGLPVGDLCHPRIVVYRCPLRAELIREESQETIDALERGDLVSAVDGWCDTIYVAEGAAVEFGILPDEGPLYPLASVTPELNNAQLLACVLEERTKHVLWRTLRTGLVDQSSQYEGDLKHDLSMLIRVCRWSAARCGVDLKPFFEEVHRSNMSKVGGPIRADGKRLKGPNYSPPSIREMLIERGWQAA